MAENYEKDLEIDKFNLDEACQNHSVLLMKYCKKSAQAEAEAKRTKEHHKIIEAELFVDIKRQLLQGGEKATEKTIDSLVLKDAKYRKAVNDRIEAEETASILDGAVKAFMQRKSMIDNLVSLNLAGYYSALSGKQKEQKKGLKKYSKK